MLDVIIIGAGPAGLTAGIYLARAGYKPLILEKETIGGQIASSPLIENFPGFKSISGSEFADNLYEQVISLGANIEIENVIKIEDGKIKKVITEDNVYKCKAVIIATGSKYRQLGIEDEEKFIGKGIHFCTSCDGAFYKDKVIAVIGGANSAAINAIYMSNIANKVYLIYRGEKLKCEKTLEDKINCIDNIEVMYNKNITCLEGTDELTGIILNDSEKLKLSAIFLSIGMDAQTGCFDSIIETSLDKYFSSKDCKTSLDGIFVAGDCREKKIRQLTTAVNDGTIAATLVIDYLK